MNGKTARAGRVLSATAIAAIWLAGAITGANEKAEEAYMIGIDYLVLKAK